MADNQAYTDGELPKSLTVYIPKNIDIKKMLSENPPKFKYHKDNFLYILDLVTQLPAKQKNDD